LCYPNFASPLQSSSSLFIVASENTFGHCDLTSHGFDGSGPAGVGFEGEQQREGLLRIEPYR
jgi:hypothetical protein